MDGGLKITRERFRNCFKPGTKEKVDQMRGSDVEKCPAYQSVKGCIRCSWGAEVEEA